jgi:transposase
MREIPTAPGYFVTEDGKVIGKKFGRAVSQWVDSRGYANVTIYSVDGKKRFSVHVLVAEAFHGARPDGMVCMHINGNPSDNKADNLMWGTQSENKAHELQHGTRYTGQKHHKAKLSDQDVVQIKLDMASGMRNTDICKKYGISSATAAAIKVGRQWKCVPWPEGWEMHAPKRPKLNEIAARVIKYMLNTGVSAKRIALAYKVSETTVLDILKGRSYAHI